MNVQGNALRRCRAQALILLVVAVLGGCGGTSETSAARQSQSGETALQESSEGTPAPVDIDDYLPEAGLDRLTRESSLVISGEVVETRDGVLIGDDLDASYTIYTVRVDQVVLGERVDIVSVSLMTELDSAPFQPPGRPVIEVGDVAIWLLTELAPEFDRQGYVLTNQNSLLSVDVDGNVTGGSASAAVAAELRELVTIGPVLKYLRSAAQG